MTENIVKYRKDYTPPTHFVETIDLVFDLNEEVTQVTSTMKVKSNPENVSQHLDLHGDSLELISIKLNGEVLPEADYKLDDEFLHLKNLPIDFELEIVTEIKPQENTTLMGLYKSGGNFCTQCESDGFRRITYCMDRPDVMSLFTTKIIADPKKYPVLLSNGNLIEEGKSEDGRHFAIWQDPFKKPCYLFALVAGDLAHIEDVFKTCSGRDVTLKIFAAHKEIDKCHFAMQALKKSMRWDEEVYGREYDLDIFMIVAVNDFNFGAMENKGLNIFNDKYILANPETATDQDYAGIDMVVSHEYFHNWSGNRVTLRDWFQLSLKEGLTVFRDHSFSESIGLAPVERIGQVKRLRAAQFPEDAGPLAHPIRPDSYIEMNNFYTSTVYEKGSEVIRMMKTILGSENYRKGTDLYFDRHDGCAVTCEDFVKAMEDASQADLSQFRLWYSQAGTPELKVSTEYDEGSKQYYVDLEQIIPDTPGQKNKKPMHIPLVLGLLDANGDDMSVVLEGSESKGPSYVLNLKDTKARFTFSNVNEKPVMSLLRGFSAPVLLEYDYTEEELAFLMAHDSDSVARWEAAQQFSVKVLMSLIKQFQADQDFTKPVLFVETMRQVLRDDVSNKALLAEMLNLPSYGYLADLLDIVDVEAIVAARYYLREVLAHELRDNFMAVYKALDIKRDYEYCVKDCAERSLKNACLSYLIMLDDEMIAQMCFDQFTNANNMTDQMAALVALCNIESPYHEEAVNEFFAKWKSEPLVLDKWFSAQALSHQPSALPTVKALMVHEGYDEKNPNKVRALIGAFSQNFSQFHQSSGEGYELLANEILRLDKLNPMTASRLATIFSRWKRFKAPQCDLMKAELERIVKTDGLSKNVYEIVSKSLG